ncbi:hypothetical protein Droror1_Dr00026826 [Drosera rotundifolia]
MSLLFTSPPYIFSTSSPKNNLFRPRSPLSLSLSLSLSSPLTTFTTYLRSSSSYSFSFDSTSSSDDSPNPSSGPEPEPISSGTDVPDADPPRSEAVLEWGRGNEEEGVGVGNGSVGEADDGQVVDSGILIRCLVDTVYGTELGFRASAEVRAEVFELVNQLEGLNPNPSPVENPGLLDGNWVLLYTAFSELLPLLAVGATPLLKVERISQSIDTSSSTIENSTTLSGPFATFSFSASASFEVRSPSRVQVQFQEWSSKPPEIKSKIDLPTDVDVFGLKINLSPVGQLLNPVQEAVANISRTISGLPPIRVPIPGEGAASWLLITYLDEDLRISRGDGGLFVLAREGSPLLQQ